MSREDKKLKRTVTAPELRSLSQMVKEMQEEREKAAPKAYGESDSDRTKGKKAERQAIIFRAKRSNIGDFVFVVAKAMDFDAVFTGVTRQGRQFNLGLQQRSLETPAYKTYLKGEAAAEAKKIALANAASDPAKAALLLELAKGGALTDIREADILAVIPVTDEPKS